MYRFRKDKDGNNRGDTEREAEDFAKVPSEQNMPRRAPPRHS